MSAWVEGMVAEWPYASDRCDYRYFISRVTATDTGYCLDLLNLDSMKMFEDERYSRMPNVIIREPTDDELKRVAIFRLIGDDATLLRGITEC